MRISSGCRLVAVATALAVAFVAGGCSSSKSGSAASGSSGTTTAQLPPGKEPEPLADGAVAQVDILDCTGVCNKTLLIWNDGSWQLRVDSELSPSMGAFKPDDFTALQQAIGSTDFAQLRARFAHSTCPSGGDIPVTYQFRKGATVEKVRQCGTPTDRVLALASIMVTKAALAR